MILLTGFATALFGQEYQPVIEVKTAPLKMILGGVGVSTDFCLNDNVSIESIIQYKQREITERKVISLQGFGKYYLNSKKGADGIYIGGYLKMQRREFGSTLFSDSGIEKRLAMGMISGYKLVSPAGVLIDFTAGFGNKIFSKWTPTNNNINASTSSEPDAFNFDYILRMSVGYRFGTVNDHSKTGKLQRKEKLNKKLKK